MKIETEIFVKMILSHLQLFSERYMSLLLS